VYVQLLLLVTLAFTGPASAGPESDIRATLDRQVVAWNDGDLEGFMEGYLRSEELVFTSGGNVRRGWETTLRKYREHYGNAKETMGRLSFSDLEIHMLGPSAAWVLGRWSLEYADGRSEGGVFTLVMQEIDGHWRVVHDHTSASSK